MGAICGMLLFVIACVPVASQSNGGDGKEEGRRGRSDLQSDFWLVVSTLEGLQIITINVQLSCCSLHQEEGMKEASCMINFILSSASFLLGLVILVILLCLLW